MEETPSVGADVDLNALDAYDYDLPEGLIATEPAPDRTGSRLLVDSGTGGLDHRRFADLPRYLRPGDLLVFNDTRVIPARLLVKKSTGGKVELFVLQSSPDFDQPTGSTVEFRCLTRSSKPVRSGTELTSREFPQMPPIRVKESGPGKATVEAAWDGTPLEFLESFGRTPLPPYIERAREQQGLPVTTAADPQRYQTVYARAPGAVAAPTAGLHFSPALLDELDALGVARASLTLTVGPGTFQPVRAERLDEHEMHSEEYTIPPELSALIQKTRHRKGRIVAVGTTSARALEAEMVRENPFQPGSRSTDIFLRPGVSFRLVDGLITNFHLPRSTLLALVAAFLGFDRMRRLYREAIAEGYRFYSYGDSSLLFRTPQEGPHA